MAFHFLVLFSLLNLAFAGSHAALLPEEVHWKNVFPNTPLPKALKDLLPQTAVINAPVTTSNTFAHQDGNYNNHEDANYNNHQDGNYNNHDDANYNSHQDGNYNNQESKSGDPFKLINVPATTSNTFAHQDANYNNHQDGNYNNHHDGNNHQDGNYNNQEFKSGDPFKRINVPTNNYNDKYGDEDSNTESKSGKPFKEINVPASNYNDKYGFEDSTKESKRGKIFKEKNYNDKYGDEDSTKESKRRKLFKEINVPATNYNDKYGDEDSTKESKRWKPFKGNKNFLGGSHENAALINETIYFFQEDLYSGKMVKLSILKKPRDSTTFLPNPVAELIPFSSDKLPEILKQLSVEAESSEAYAMKETIKGCERNVIRGEEMYCTTSFESFVDSSVSKLGNNIQLLSHEIGKETKTPVFTIGSGIKNMGEKELVCHKMEYPYAVFLCHSIHRTVVYKVPLVSIDGTKSNALAVCHKDTSAWNPKHTAFQILKVKPGTVPVCHFVLIDTLIWVSN